MSEPDHVPDLMHQDGQQVNAAERGTPSACCTAAIGEDLSELGTLARGRIDEPNVTGGIGIDGYRVTVGLAQNALGQVGDADLEIGEAPGKRPVDAGGFPDPEGLFKNGGESLIGQA